MHSTPSRPPTPATEPASERTGHPDTLRFGGLTALTTIDYPGDLAAVVFCQGCPWRCDYCHNAHLLDSRTPPTLTWQRVRDFLQRRRGLLDGVVFSGGEPTLQKALPAVLQAVREMGFKVGLHSAGCYPERLARLLPWLDWVGLDIKAQPEDYPALTGVRGSGERAWRSLDLLRRSDVAFDVRITLHDGLQPAARLKPLLERLRAAGVATPRLQPCRNPASRSPERK